MYRLLVWKLSLADMDLFISQEMECMPFAICRSDLFVSPKRQRGLSLPLADASGSQILDPIVQFVLVFLS